MGAERRIIEQEVLKYFVVSLSLGEHMGDVNDSLTFYAPKLGLPEPEWDEERDRLVWPWEELEDLDEE